MGGGMKYDSRKEEITKIVVHLAGFLHRAQKDKQPLLKYLHIADLPRIRYFAKQEKSASQL